MDEMPQHSTVIALAVHEQLCHVTTLQLIRAISLISCLKRDIQLPQPLSENPGCAPTVLPPAISDFLSDSISLPPELMHDFWTSIKDDAWNAPVKDEPTEDDEECFRQYGWQRELSEFKFQRQYGLFNM